MGTRGDSNEYSQSMFLWRNKQNYPLKITKYPPYLFHCLGMKTPAPFFKYETFSNIIFNKDSWTIICCDNPKSAYLIIYFPPFGYQPAWVDNLKSCGLNFERLSWPGLCATHDVSGMVLCDFTHFLWQKSFVRCESWFFQENNSKQCIWVCDKSRSMTKPTK